MIAANFDEFVKTISQAEREALNSDFGQLVTYELLQMKLEDNPNMTQEEWSQAKSEFMTFLFYQIVQNEPALLEEFGSHVYTALRES